MYVKVLKDAVVAFPYGIRELMQDNPNTSFPERVDDAFLAQYGIYPVIPKEIPQPFHNVMQNATTVNPVFTGEAWVQEWQITPASTEDIAQRLADLAQNVRSTRNQLLAETDWTQVIDSPVNLVTWATYRKALRDITEQAGFPENVIWPIAPN
jgi:hypothetical protein